ncbi:nucleotide sugar dehydrogenase [Halopseudomonas salegens]|uniref:UDP-glucose 6-dehydrogenase n=1 Tax=Halopseudomonas salegens TaxID=1434072 RepID=A0A1H2FKG3_9GAMM|nr:nucleotide sugar dehydrogenase [Halopseudomonas salegens]SDU07836.1 UDPglucose 6-dehydrogenase [Halopseudomonas salegens]
MQLDVYGNTLFAVVTAGMLASTGHEVTLRVPEGALAEQLAAGRSGFSEPGLAQLLTQQREQKRLRFADFDALPDPGCRAVFVGLGAEEYAVAKALIERIARVPGRNWLVVNQSPFAVGSTEELNVCLRTLAAQAEAAVVSLPDFLQEGQALKGMAEPEKIILGCDLIWAEHLVREIFRPFCRGEDPFLVMTPREAEFTKLAITGMLVTRISFMNDMAAQADSLGLNIDQVRRGLAADSRIGPAYLQPGVGFGGPGFASNVINLVDTLQASGVGSQLLNQVLAINERQKEVLFRKLWQHYQTELEGRVVAIWGAAFKPGTGRIDNAPVLRTLEALWAQGASVRIHDPEALPALQAHYGEREDLQCIPDAYAAAEGADALMLMTQWQEYGSPDFSRLLKLMREPVLLDGRNIYDPTYVRSHGFVYYGVGR